MLSYKLEKIKGTVWSKLFCLQISKESVQEMMESLSKKHTDYLYSKENIEKLRLNRKNQKESPFRGHSWKDKVHPRGFKGYKHTEEARRKMSHPGESNPMFGVSLPQNIERMKNGGAMKAMSANRRTSKPERIMMRIIKEHNLPFNYVGNGKITFKGENHSFNPDFLSKNPKHIIEVFGNYWHNLPERKEIDKERLDTYRKYGYKTLVIWSNELKDTVAVISKINKFILGGI